MRGAVRYHIHARMIRDTVNALAGAAKQRHGR